MYFSQFVGVDISKDTLDAAIYPAKDKKLDFLHFDNTQKGLGEMMSWLKSRGVKPADCFCRQEGTGSESELAPGYQAFHGYRQRQE